MRKARADRKSVHVSGAKAVGACLCGAVRIEIAVPAFWAWHDHSKSSQRAQGCAYATYVGCWKSRVRVLKGRKNITGFEDPAGRAVRSFCAKCGTPLLYERAHAPKMTAQRLSRRDGGTDAAKEGAAFSRFLRPWQTVAR